MTRSRAAVTEAQGFGQGGTVNTAMLPEANTPDPSTPYVPSNEATSNSLGQPGVYETTTAQEAPPTGTRMANSAPPVAMNPATAAAARPLNFLSRGNYGKAASKHAKPPSVFTAKAGGEVTVQAFARQMRHFLRSEDYEDEKDKIYTISTFLEGEAHEWYETKEEAFALEEEAGVPSTYTAEQLLEELVEDYTDHSLPLEARAKYNRIVQGNDTVQSFALEVRRLGLLCRPVVPEDQMLEKLKDGLSLRIKRAFAAQLTEPPSDWRTFVRVANNMETRMRHVQKEQDEQKKKDDGGATSKSGSKKSSYGGNKSKSPNSGNSKEAGSSTPQSQGNKAASANKNRQRREGRCFNCDSTEHKFYECPSNTKNPKGPGRN